MNTPEEPRGTPTRKPGWVDRHQSLAAVLIVMFSMFSPTIDLRPKPLLPAQYEMADPSDPPDLDALVNSTAAQDTAADQIENSATDSPHSGKPT